MGYGAAHGVASHALGRAATADGLVTGPAAFANSDTVLPLLGIYQPIWEYDAATIYKDLSAHLVLASRPPPHSGCFGHGLRAPHEAAPRPRLNP